MSSDWQTEYARQVKVLNQKTRNYKNAIGALKRAGTWAAGGLKYFGVAEPESRVTMELADTLFQLTKLLKEHFGDRINKEYANGHLIDTKQFLAFVKANDDESQNTYAKDHFDTLVLQRNALQSESFDLKPFLGIAGLVAKFAAAGAVAAALGGAAYVYLN